MMIEQAIKRGDYDSAILEIESTLKSNLTDPFMYFYLGWIYEEKKEYNKAFLYYEQACFLSKGCKEEADYKKRFDQFKTDHQSEITVGPLAIVILTYNQLVYTKQCIQSILQTISLDSIEIIIVDNHSTDGTVEWIKSQSYIKAIYNDENLGFPKGCNQGIRLANPSSDILLLNNDTILMENSLLNLRIGLYESEMVGCTGSTSNVVAGRQKIEETFDTVDEYHNYALSNNIPCSDRYFDILGIKGFCMLIKRSALTSVGELDEQFALGNFEDNDYCRRLKEQNYTIYVCKNSFTFHYGSRSFRLLGAGYIKLLKENQEKYNKKWNIDQ